MKKYLLSSIAMLLPFLYAMGQCDLDFGSTAGQFNFSTQSGSDIVNASSSGANESSVQSFNIWDETIGDCAMAGGLNDITFEFSVIHAFDQYMVDGIIDPFAGSTHDITQSSSGLRGNIPLGNSSTNESSTGDVRGYSITITFADHIDILAGDLIVDLTSVNTAGEAHESSSIVFLDGAGSPYGTATYAGYYAGSTGASTDGTCTTPAVNTNSWSTTGIGVYTASSTVNTDITAPCDPVAGVDGSANNTDVNPVTDAGLSPTNPIGGLIFTVYLEDVAASTAPGAETSTSTQFTSTLNGLSIASSPLPVELITFQAQEKNQRSLLEWSTASEVNNDFFEVQWSQNGVQFETIGWVQGQGTSFEINHYEFIHNHPTAGNNYYRLRQVDFDAHFSLSEIELVKIESKKVMTIFPTLATSHITLDKPEAIESRIIIYDVNQKIIRDFKDNGDQRLELDVANLPAGNYYISVINKAFTQTKAFLKLAQ